MVRSVLRIVFENEDRGRAARNLLFETASTIIPSAASLSAIADSGAILPAAVPEV